MRNNNVECPHCKCNKVIKFGSYNGKQRYRCKNEECKKTFIEDNESPFRYAKKFNLLWEEYFKLMVDGKTIRECAEKLNITIVTAFFWRHKILYDFKDRVTVEELKDHVEVSKLVTIENFKGSRKIIRNERNKIIIINGIDKHRDVISLVTSRGNCSFRQLREGIFTKINRKAYAVAIQDWIIGSVAKKHNEKNNIKLEKKIEEIDRAFSLKTKQWIKRFYGVATKYIDHYLSWRAISYKNNIDFKGEDWRREKHLSNDGNIKINIGTYISWKNVKVKSVVV